MPQRPPRPVRFVAAQLERFPPDRLHARVVLRRSHDDLIIGTAERPFGEAHELACVAEAAAAAVRQAAEADAEQVVSVRAVERLEAFGQPIVMVAVSAQRQQQTRDLTGFCQADGDAPRATALAILNATNRFLDLG